jgi:hypothetical protein
MASERQIEANRLNGRKSTGPRSAAGKKRAGRNALRHGLTSILPGKEFAEAVKKLARKIAGQSTDPSAFEYAQAAAEAELELARVRHTRLALIERASALGSLKPPRHFQRSMDLVWWLIAVDKWVSTGRKRPYKPTPLNPVPAMPTTEPERASEALRRVLPELVKLTRYESRAVARRDRAVREFSARCMKEETRAPVRDMVARSEK